MNEKKCLLAINLNLQYMVIAGGLMFSSMHVHSSDEGFDFFDEVEFISATGTARPITTTPAIVSIITADDIKAMGARDLDQVLESIPGFHVVRTNISVNPSYVVRGNYSSLNQRTMVLIDGVSISHLYFNNRGTTWGGMPLHRIEKIEVVRGPGSAVYGADAFTGVINIITKSYDSLENEFGVRLGGDDTKEAWLLQKAKWGDTKATFSLELLSTEGSGGHILSDAATTPTNNVSNAPGELNRGRDLIESRLELRHRKWLFRLGYQGRHDVGTGAGHAGALDPEGNQDSDRINADLTHIHQSDSKQFEITTQLSARHIAEDIQLKLFPDGFAGAYENGVIGEPSYKERHYRGEITALYHGFDDHTVRTGVGSAYGMLTDIKEKKNFDANFAPLASVVDVTGDSNLIFIESHSRTIRYLYFQDEWQFTPDWVFTLGLRYDHYSNFGDTLNQRLALVWQPAYNLTVKLLYGSAFRPPSFADLYLINNPAANGNPNLKPETIDTFDLALNYRFSADLQLNVNTYVNTVKQLIETSGTSRLAPAPQNIGEQESYGTEMEFDWTLNDRLTLIGNVSWQKTLDKNRDVDAGLSPRSQVYIQARANISERLLLNTTVNWVDKQGRAPGDPREDIEAYTQTDIHLRYTHQTLGAMGITITNMFNGNIRDPASASIPYDFPGAGRQAAFYYEYEW